MEYEFSVRHEAVKYERNDKKYSSDHKRLCSLCSYQRAVQRNRIVHECNIINSTYFWFQFFLFTSVTLTCLLLCVFLNALLFSQIAKKFTEESFASHIRSLISSNGVHDPLFYNLTSYVDSMGTTHVSVLAEDGSAVSVTSTINHMSVFDGVTVRNQQTDTTVSLKAEDYGTSVSVKRIWK